MPLKKIDYIPFLEACWQEHLQPKAENAPTVISTFAGAGGSSLGYSMAGFRELLAVEWDNNAVETFKLNFPDVPVYHGDIAKLSVDEVLQITGLKVGELDVFDGSPPCQGFSTAGKRQLDDPRNQLFREYVRLLRGLRPKVFIMENVSGMVKGVMKLVFVEILKELKASGYKVSARLLNAMYFNVPQSRQRMIFIGVREDLGIEPSHPEAESVPVSCENALNGVTPCEYRKPHDGQMYAVEQCKPGEALSKYHPKGYWFSYFRIPKDKPTPTIQKSQEDKVYHFLENRVLAKNEFQILGSFPEIFLFTGNHKDAVLRIGNSVPPLFMRSIARHIRAEILKNSDTAVKNGKS
jgi:DNA (cytosine-5)-methyltransferase 1